MPGKAEYWYELKLGADEALKEGKQFAQAMQREMAQIKTTANIVLKAQIDSKAGEKAAASEADKLQKIYQQGLVRAQREFTATAARFGARDFTSSFRNMWEQGTIAPSAEAIKQIREAEGAITNLGKVAKKMGVTTDDLINMGGLDRAITAVQAVQRKIWGLRGLGYQLESYGRSMTMTAMAMGASAGLASKKYLDFAAPLGKAARNLDLNAQLTEVLDNKLTSLAGTVSMMTPQEQAEGLYLWAAATGAVVDSEDELMAVLSQADQVQRLAKLGNVEYGTAVEAVTDVLSQYQLNMSETERVVSTLIKVAAVSKAEVGDLAQAFTFAGARADQANTSFEDTAAVFQLLSAYGLRGSRAGRGIGMLLENLIAPSAVAKKELDELFTDVFGRTDVLTNAEGQFIGIAQAIGVLADATQNLTEVERAEFVAKLTSQNASRALVPLLELERAARERGISAIETTSIMLRGAANDQERQQVAVFTNMMRSLQGYTVDQKSAIDTANKQWEEYAKHVSGQAEFIKASFDASLVDIGREMTTVLLPVMQRAAELAKSLAGYTKEHPGAVKMVLGLAAGAGIAGVLTTAVGKGIRLVADVKTMAMAYTLQKAAKDNIQAATMSLAAAQMELRAAGMEAGGAGAQAVGGLGGAAAAGASLMGIAGPIALAITGVAALASYVAYLKEKDRSERESAAVAAATAETYDVYLQRLKDVGNEQNAVTEATYDLIRAKQAEGDSFSEFEAEEYASSMAEAQKGLEDFLATSKELFVLRGIRAEDAENEAAIQQLIAFNAKQVATELVAGADQYTLALLTQSGVVEKIISDLHYEAGVAKQIGDEVQRMASVQSAVAAGESIGERPPEELAYAYMAKGATEATQAIEGTDSALEGLASAEQAAASGAETFVNAASAMDATLRRVKESLEASVAQLERFSGSAPVIAQLSGVLSNVDGQLRRLRGAAVDMGIEEGAKLGMQALEDLESAAESAADSGFGQFRDLVGIMPSEDILGNYQKYLDEMQNVYQQAAMMGEREGELFIRQWEMTWEEWVGDHKDAQDRITQQAEDAQKERERFLEDAQQGFQGLVEAALKPTSVTGLDMLQTDMGAYVDKWDEAARRMRAAMEDPSGQWGFMIPEDIKAQGLDAAKAWGQNWIDQFYAGMHPDQINWSGFVQSFRDSLAREISQGQLVDRAIEELAKEGITATSDEVIAALGLQSPLQSMFLGGLTPEDAGVGLSQTLSQVMGGVTFEEGTFDSAASAISGNLSSALTTKLSTVNLPALLGNMWNKQMSESPEGIIAVGRRAGNLFWSGFEESLEDAGIVEAIIRIVLTQLSEEIEGDT